MTSDKVDSLNTIKYNLKEYRIFGAYPPEDATRRKIYFTVLAPVHCFCLFFIFGFIHSVFSTPFENSTEATSSSLVLMNILLRAYIFYYYGTEVKETFTLMAELDTHVKQEEDKATMMRAIKYCRILEIWVHVMIHLMLAAKFLGIIANFNGERVSLFPIWLPFDWATETWIYLMSVLYQFIVIEFEIVGYCANQLVAPTSICMMIAHIQILQSQLQRIGNDATKSAEDNHRELLHCARMFNLIYRIFEVYGRIISLQMATQYCISALELAMNILLTIYFQTSVTSTAYSGLYVINTIFSELLIACWFGEQLKSESDNFTNAYFSMNWVAQNHKFKKDLIMMMQRSQSGFDMMAGFFHINLRSFVLILRFAYSASLLLRNLKD